MNDVLATEVAPANGSYVGANRRHVRPGWTSGINAV